MWRSADGGTPALRNNRYVHVTSPTGKREVVVSQFLTFSSIDGGIVHNNEITSSKANSDFVQICFDVNFPLVYAHVHYLLITREKIYAFLA